MFDPNSAKARIYNHLSYKLGKALLQKNNRFSAGGGLLLRFFKIIFLHKKQQKLYKQSIILFPHLRYPKLETCFDYKQSLVLKTHLPYLLGQSIIKAYQNWYKGGFITLFSEINKAKLKHKNIENLFLKLKQKDEALAKLVLEDEIFIDTLLNDFSKAYLILILFDYSKDYKVLQDLLVRHFKENFSFMFQHIDLIKTWLFSEEFKKTYFASRAPFPPLLDPKIFSKQSKLYENIPATLAWNINLPLQEEKAKFVFFIFGGSGHAALLNFFEKLKIKRKMIDEHCFYDDFKTQFIISAHWQTNTGALSARKRAYLARNYDFVLLVRDPIERIYHAINHGAYKREKLDGNFNFNDDLRDVLDRKCYLTKDGWRDFPNINITSFYIQTAMKDNFAYASLAKACAKEVFYIDNNEILPQNVLETFRTFKPFLNAFNLELLEKEKGFLTQRLMSGLRYILPLRMHLKDIEIYIDLKYPLLTFHTSFDEKILAKQTSALDFIFENYIDMSNNLFDEELAILDYVGFFIPKEQISKFQITAELRAYLKKLALYLAELKEKHENAKVSKEELLEYLKKDKESALKFKKLLDQELEHIKIHRPDIMNSWTYYKLFMKNCENF